MQNLHSYLKAVGFSRVKSRKETENLLEALISSATEKKVYKINEEITAAELVADVGDNIGIIIRGEYDKDGKFYVEHFVPYYWGQHVSTAEATYISKRVETDGYTVMCEDYRLGVSLIFYLLNAIDYKNAKRKGLHELYPIRLCGLALEGKILLPTLRTEYQMAQKKEEIIARSKLIIEAKRGNQEAMETLTMEDIDQYAVVSRRIRTEDVYSIVESTFIPHGTESDNYMIIGIIKDVKVIDNFLTQEEMYILYLLCNEVDIEVCINKKDLLGEPLPGRRFRGVIWLQGIIEFWV